jgi:YHS domain-containing protein
MQFKIILVSAILMMLTVSAYSQIDQARKKEFNISNKGIALQGYDAVSYFKSAAPKMGTAEFAYTYQGITYWFESKANKVEFASNSTKYEPAYGGWCAYAMGNSGEKVEVNPETFKIINNTLYLFYNAYFTNTLTKWNKNEAVLKAAADNNWKKFNPKK